MKVLQFRDFRQTGNIRCVKAEIVFHDRHDCFPLRQGVGQFPQHPVAFLGAAREGIPRENRDEERGDFNFAQELLIEFSRVKTLLVDEGLETAFRQAALDEQRRRPVLSSCDN